MRPKNSYVVRNGTVVFPDRGEIEADIAVREGRIAAICEPGTNVLSDAETIDAKGCFVFPGFIDAHVHFGFAEPIVEYSTETIYAAHGGVSTIAAYLLNNDSYVNIFADQKKECEARSYIDFAFHFCAAGESHIEEIGRYVREYGVNSFKYFMNFKGEEGRYMGLDGTDDGFLHDLLLEAASLERVIIVIHPENIELVNRLRPRFQMGGRDGLKDYCLSKPPITEAESMVRAMYFAEHAGCTIYFPHLSCDLGLVEARRYRERYDRIYLETCPHYLTHTMDADIGSIGRANPPLRSQADVDALWQGLADGTIEVIASDHVPRKRATKEKGIWQATQGFPGTATILPVLLSEGYHKDRLSLQRIAKVFSQNPARIFGMDERKGNIFVGADADLTIVDLDRVREVVPDELGSYSDYSLYEGWKMRGWPVLTMVRGVVVMRDGEITGPAGHGKYLARPLTV
jgi:dihydropyrimidinase